MAELDLDLVRCEGCGEPLDDPDKLPRDLRPWGFDSRGDCWHVDCAPEGLELS